MSYAHGRESFPIGNTGDNYWANFVTTKEGTIEHQDFNILAYFYKAMDYIAKKIKRIQSAATGRYSRASHSTVI